MSGVDTLLEALQKLDATIRVEDGRLHVSVPKGTLPAELRAELSRRKDEVIAALSAAGGGMLPRVPRDRALPMSFGQQRLWFLTRMSPDVAIFNILLAPRIQGPFDEAAMRRALAALVERHEVLRTRLTLDDGRPVQVIDPPGEPVAAVEAVDAPSPQAGDAYVVQQARAELARPFALDREPPFRARILRLSETDHVLMMTVHHSAVDGWSLSLLQRDVAAFYRAFSAGEASPLPPLPVQYADFAAWQRETLTDDLLARERAYWFGQLAGVDAALELPGDRPRPAVQSNRSRAITRPVPAALMQAARALGRRHRSTPFMTLLAAWAIVLARFTGRRDIAIGSPVASRGRRELEDLIGFFVNSLVLRVRLEDDPTFAELVARVRQTTLDGHAHQHMPFERLVEELRPERDLSRHPIFQMEFVLHAAAPAMELPGLARLTSDEEPEAPPAVDRATALDLSLEITDSEERPSAMLAFNADIFDESTCRRLLDYFELVVASVVEDPGRRISQLPPCSTADERQVAVWNQTELEYPRAQCLHDLVAAQARQTPEAIAVEAAEGLVSYRDLDGAAGRVAARLQQAGVGPGARVGVYMERSRDLVPALLGILKTGAAYIPLDPAFPADRIAYMLADSNAAAVIVDRASAPSLPPSKAPVLQIDELQDAKTTAAPATVAMSPEDVAYVIYTSGSTGRPKGVQVPHRGVVNFLTSMRQAPGLAAADKLLAVTTLSFDIAGLELFLPLTTGATIVLARREEAADPVRLMALLRERRITVMQATPATWRMLLDAGWSGSHTLRILCGGEAMPDDLAQALCGRSESVWNLYGPTETTIWSTVERVTPGTTITIGRPIANTRILVVDETLRPVPIGAAGEICIAGDGVARGYLGRPELTSEKFVSDPTGAPGARMYRTGDLGRYRNDGRLQYLGRIDHQVKLRGFRIELGEIEAVLASHPGVARAVARVREDVPGDARLVAYVVPGESSPGLLDDLKQLVTEKLPTYMHPSAYMVLDALPLTPNGKVDRAALPAPERSAPAAAAIAPSTDAEERIAAVWREVLRLDQVGVNHSFFDLGGHSLLLVQVQSRLSTAFGRSVSILDLFQYPTIAALARHLGGASDKTAATFADEASARVRRGSDDRNAAIAIVGLAGRFPAAADVDVFWQNLRNGVEGIKFFSDEELEAAGVPAQVRQQANYVKARGVLDGFDLFDAGLFGFTPREADLMDPQQRVFLECAWEALERAGYDPQRYPGLIGMFAGASLSGYVVRAILSGAFGGNEVELLLNGDKDHLPTRVSYKLNLRGPSVNVQTACSTSLVAVHMACRSLLDRECDMALAGGVSVGPQAAGYSFVEGSIMSPDGHCRTFDAKARGTVSASGLGVVVLKRLGDAIADGDHIHAVLLGTGINNDGSAKIGYTAPSVDGESKAIALAQAVAGCRGDSISYVEAHGTGTALGDPIEVKALTQVFREATSARGYCAIGSVKSNIGHLDAAAGVAGLIKTALALEHREIPPSLHFESPNPEIDFAGSPFFVNTTLRQWETPAGVPRRAAISSFGLGGTNAHAVLEEAPEAAPSGPSRDWQLLPIAARTEAALDALSDRLASRLASQDVNLADACFSLAVGRQQLEHRRVVAARTASEAAASLQSRTGARVATGRVRQAPRIAFLFPGQGAQQLGMGADLYRAEPVFRREVDACADAFRAALAVDVREVLCPAEGDRSAESRLQTTVVTQAALFTLEYALARLWMSWGIVPTAMLGHSIGEYVAAAIGGALTLADAVTLVARRAQLMEAAPAGAMLAVSAPIASIRAIDLPGVSIAAVNGPAQCVLSGAREPIDRAVEALSARGIDTRLLQTAGAFHSALMDGVVAPLTETARQVRCGRPRIPYVSNVTGQWIGEADLNADYWARHMRGTVEFQAGVESLMASGADVFLEVGPGQTLGALARQICTQQDHRAEVFQSLPRPGAPASDREHIAWTLARLWTAGAPVEWADYFGGERRRRVVLPTYPFERKRHWLEVGAIAAPAAAVAGPPAKDPDLANWFFTPEWQSQPGAVFDADAVRSAGPWIVFADDAGLGRRLAAQITACGAGAVVVEAGEAFERIGDDYRLAPGRPEQFDALVADLQRDARVPAAVLHAWTFGASDLDSSALIDRAYTSLVQFVRASGAVGVELPRTFGIVTSGVHKVTGLEVVTPEAATSLGPTLVLPAEHAEVRCRAIDLAADEWTAENPQRERTLLATVLDHATPALAAIRGRRTWGRAFHQQRVDGFSGPLRFKTNGTYLITGGYGGIGLELAAYLAETCAARLVLTGREGLPERSEWPAIKEQGDPRLKRRIESVEALEARGAEVLTAPANVSDEKAMRRVVAMAQERFGGIDGVIHAAGVPGARVMQLDEGRDSAAVLEPKVAGTRVLLRALESVHPDFVVLCSSINTVSGAMGQAAYTAANAFLDAVARGASESGPEILAINWDPWQEVGMAVNTVVPERMARARREELKHGILPAEGREAFVRLLHTQVGPQVIVSTRDFRPRRIPRSAAAPAAAAKPDSAPHAAGHERPALSQPYVAPRNPIEEEVAAVWQRLFGMAQIGVDDDFFELGGHSLLATQVVSRLREQFRVNLPLAALFDAPTVAGLSLAIMERLMEAESSAIPQAS